MNIPQQQKEQLAYNLKLTGEQYLKRAEERERKEKLAQQLKEKEAKEAEEARIKAEEEERKKLLLAPDKDKLLKLVADIHKVQRPHLESMEASEILEKANDLIIRAVDIINEGVKKL